MTRVESISGWCVVMSANGCEAAAGCSRHWSGKRMIWLSVPNVCTNPPECRLRTPRRAGASCKKFGHAQLRGLTRAAVRNLPQPDHELIRSLNEWERQHGRSFPWRSDANPFRLLTAEIFLQRTRADQVLPVYEDFAERVIGPSDVLDIGRDQVDDWFSALGLKWRAEHYWNLCRELVAEYEGEVPADRDALIGLPGVGQYAAGSTLTYAFGKPTGVADSNILRVYARYYGIEFSDVDRRRREVLEWVDDHLPDDPDDGRMYSLGIVDLGAMICRPRKPLCESCPVAASCVYAASHIGS